MNKRGVSPLIATGILVVFALLIGTVTMSWGKSYVEGIAKKQPSEETFGNTVIIDLGRIDTPLKKLQLEHITEKISEEEYLSKEKELVR